MLLNDGSILTHLTLTCRLNVITFRRLQGKIYVISIVPRTVQGTKGELNSGQMSSISRRQEINNEVGASCMFLPLCLLYSLCEVLESPLHRKGHWDLEKLSAFLNSGTLTRFQK